MPAGYLLINKPPGPTSHDIVDNLRRLTGIKRIGHAGTLDPFARGLLLIGVEREATRNLAKFVGLDKRYRAVLRLGYVSDTYDRTGRILEHGRRVREQEVKSVYLGRVEKILQLFIGKQKQVPPIYSAKKIQGKKAYELARKGQKVKLNRQEVEIYTIKLTPDSGSRIPDSPIIDVHCSSGTYIRTLAHDIGQKLGCGAYLEELERTAIGNFTLAESVDLSKLTKGNWLEFLINFKKVMACGTFEILHAGHKFYLREAKKLGQKLTVVVARDKRAEQLRKRKLRLNEARRLQKIKLLDFVDEAVLGDEVDLYQTIKKNRPDIIALGYDQRDWVRELPDKIKEFGLRTKIARIPAYHPEKYKSSLLIHET